MTISKDHIRGAESAIRTTLKTILDNPNLDRKAIIRMLERLSVSFEAKVQEEINRRTEERKTNASH